MSKADIAWQLSHIVSVLPAHSNRRLDARWLVGLALGQDEPVMGYERHLLSTAQQELLDVLVSERLAGKPISRIRGKRGFYRNEFFLNDATLDPRPDTETLVEAALAHAARHPAASCSFLDLGTGTGCVLLSVLDEMVHAYGVGIDCHPLAVAQARANAAYLGLAERAEIRRGNWCEGLEQKFDILLANPPYIAEDDPNCAPDVREFDPHSALFAGADGYSAYREFLPQLHRHMHPTSICFTEIGIGQESDISEIAASCGLQTVAMLNDLTERVRVLALKTAQVK